VAAGEGEPDAASPEQSPDQQLLPVAVSPSTLHNFMHARSLARPTVAGRLSLLVQLRILLNVRGRIFLICLNLFFGLLFTTIGAVVMSILPLSADVTQHSVRVDPWSTLTKDGTARFALPVVSRGGRHPAKP